MSQYSEPQIPQANDFVKAPVSGSGKYGVIVECSGVLHMSSGEVG